ncbi:MAG: hypothetical protein GWP08_05080 [Nitrospiraceae bacterium]|nr:hypothetical protein [Nitrospiraceae bacterium]
MGAIPLIQIGGKERTALGEELEDMGFSPLTSNSIEDVMEAMNYEPVAGIFVSNMKAGVDVLELVLSVRDEDTRIPVVVLNETKENRDLTALSQVLPGIHTISKGRRRPGVAQQVNNIIRSSARHRTSAW